MLNTLSIRKSKYRPATVNRLVALNAKGPGRLDSHHEPDDHKAPIMFHGYNTVDQKAAVEAMKRFDLFLYSLAGGPGNRFKLSTICEKGVTNSISFWVACEKIMAGFHN
jgi:hypothetical protein